MHVACLAQENKPIFSVSVIDRMDNITGDGQVEGQQAVPTEQIVKLVRSGAHGKHRCNNHLGDAITATAIVSILSTLQPFAYRG